MNLNSNHIISFIEQRWGLKKNTVARILNIGADVLSRPEPYQYDIDDIYRKFFDMGNKSSTAYTANENPAILLRALKEFLIKSKVKEDLEYIWNLENTLYTNDKDKDYKIYKAFVIEMLRRAIMKPYKDKPSPKEKEAQSRQMIELFEQAIEDYEIADYILGNYWDYSAYTVF